MLPLKILGEEHQSLVGGKAANLGRLICAGLPVPPGFCLTTAAFKQFLAGEREPEKLWAILSYLSIDRLGEANSISQQAIARLTALPMPAKVKDAVLKAWHAQRPPRFMAVRSSATVEDGAEHSFAGQFESFLNVQTEDALLAAIKTCWLSLFSARALAYQIRYDLPIEKAAMAVIVQEMVPAEMAGVLFTVNPFTRSAEQIVIEATPGLADRLVQGQVDPERVTLEKKTLQIIERHLPAGRPALDQSPAQHLGKLARKAERLFGKPLDIEWAIASGQIFLLQARPVTTAPVSRAWEDRQVWSNGNSGEVAPDVMTPLTWSLFSSFLLRIASSIFRMLGADLSRAPIIGLVAGRVYFNLNTALAALQPFPRLLLRAPNLGETLGGAHVALYQQDLLLIPREDLPNLGFRWLKYLLSWPQILRNLIAHSPAKADAWIPELQAANDALAKIDFDSMSIRELIHWFQQFLHAGFRGWDLLYLGTQAVALFVFQKACHDWLDDPHFKLGYRLFAGLGGIPETEAALALWRLAALAHADAGAETSVLNGGTWLHVSVQLSQTQSGRQFLTAWDSFMAEHGHHCRGELELLNPRWAETPDYILGLVRGYLRVLEQANPLEKQQRLAEERQQLTRECFRQLKNPLKRWIFSRALRRAQKLAFNREEWKNQAVRALTFMRRVLLALGQRLQQAGVLARSSDIFFLEINEIEPVASGQTQFDVAAIIKQRRNEYEKNLALRPPPLVVGRFEANTRPVSELGPNARVLKGIPIFPGVVSGPARVILRTDDHEQVLPGEILVAPFADPAWTPYFLTAAAVVIDQGGILSHGSIVAREYGLPAVTNVGVATRTIHTGDLVQVDGARGEVKILRLHAAQPAPQDL